MTVVWLVFFFFLFQKHPCQQHDNPDCAPQTLADCVLIHILLNQRLIKTHQRPCPVKHVDFCWRCEVGGATAAQRDVSRLYALADLSTCLLEFINPEAPLAATPCGACKWTTQIWSWNVRQLPLSVSACSGRRPPQVCRLRLSTRATPLLFPDYIFRKVESSGGGGPEGEEREAGDGMCFIKQLGIQPVCGGGMCAKSAFILL